MDKKVTLAQLKEVVQEAYDQVKANTGGKNADYIPYLANVNKDLFGISVCLLNGQTIHVGDTDYRFGIESVSKVHTAILALRQYGAKEILDKIGADATGLPFNSIIAILLENDHPSTPLVNAGAISACSMVQPIGDSAKKWDAIVGNVTDLCGSAPQLIDELYKSESDTNFNNRSIAWLLKNYNRIYDDPDLSLDLYTRQCSLGVTALQLSIAAGTIANGGVNPVTKKEVFDAVLAPKITAMIAAVGFYEHTGDWMYTSGIPAKTGVGGGVMGVLPGQFGIAAFAPPLDGSGNSELIMKKRLLILMTVTGMIILLGGLLTYGLGVHEIIPVPRPDLIVVGTSLIGILLIVSGVCDLFVKKTKEMEIEENDERNISLSNAAMASGFKVMNVTIAVSIFALIFTGYMTVVPCFTIIGAYAIGQIVFIVRLWYLHKTM